ncbi:hypothetical protein GJAV_G00197660 [Gymnothorax javanicus]|nr:hypothetical protein GJAV_G00197660 [Gymnothorax javanicus]
MGRAASLPPESLALPLVCRSERPELRFIRAIREILGFMLNLLLWSLLQLQRQ